MKRLTGQTSQCYDGDSPLSRAMHHRGRPRPRKDQLRGVRRVVSEGSTRARRPSDFPADCPPHRSHCHLLWQVVSDTRGFQHIAEFYSRRYRRRSQHCFTTSPPSPGTPSAPPSLAGSASDFGCTRLGWCDGRCVQGPGTYSPRCADPRLLATPTSCRRVAACNPN